MGGDVYMSCVHGGSIYIVNRIPNRVKTTPRVVWGGGSIPNLNPNPNHLLTLTSFYT